MGTFHVELTVKNLYEPGRQRTVRVLVDTGATYTTLPRDVLDALDCQPIGTRRVLPANLLSYRPERGSGLTGRGHGGRAGTGSRPGRKNTGASAKLSHQHPMTLSAVLGAAGWFRNRRCGRAERATGVSQMGLGDSRRFGACAIHDQRAALPEPACAGHLLFSSG